MSKRLWIIIVIVATLSVGTVSAQTDPFDNDGSGDGTLIDRLAESIDLGSDPFSSNEADAEETDDEERGEPEVNVGRFPDRINLRGVTQDDNRINEDLFPEDGVRVDWDEMARMFDFDVFPSIAFDDEVQVLYVQTSVEDQHGWTFSVDDLEELESQLGEDFVMIMGGANRVDYNQASDGIAPLVRRQHVILAAQPDPEDGEVTAYISNGFMLFMEREAAGYEFCERLRQGVVAEPGPWYRTMILYPPLDGQQDTIENFLDNACDTATAAG